MKPEATTGEFVSSGQAPDVESATAGPGVPSDRMLDVKLAAAMCFFGLAAIAWIVLGVSFGAFSMLLRICLGVVGGGLSIASIGGCFAVATHKLDKVAPKDERPGEVTPGEVTLSEVTSDEATQNKATSGDLALSEATSDEVIPGEAALNRVTSDEVIPGEVAPNTDASGSERLGGVGIS